MQDDSLACVIGMNDLRIGRIVIVRIGRNTEGKKHHQGKNESKDLLRFLHTGTSIYFFISEQRPVIDLSINENEKKDKTIIGFCQDQGDAASILASVSSRIIWRSSVRYGEKATLSSA